MCDSYWTIHMLLKLIIYQSPSPQDILFILAPCYVFPSDSTEKCGLWVGISECVWHSMTFKVLTDETQNFLFRSNLLSLLRNPCNPTFSLTLFFGRYIPSSNRVHTGINKVCRVLIIILTRNCFQEKTIMMKVFLIINNNVRIKYMSKL